MDFLTRSPSSRWVEILDPATSEQVGIRIKLLPPSDSKVRAVDNKNADSTMDKIRRGQKVSVSGNHAKDVNVLMAAVEDIEVTNKDLTFGQNDTLTKPLLKNILIDPKFNWLFSQLMRELRSEADFFDVAASS